MAPPPSFLAIGLRLPVELQSELNLSWVIGRVTRRRDPAEIDALEIQRARSADHRRAACRSLRR